MNIQDKLERILRELHITVSRAPVSEADAEFVLVQKKEMQRQLTNLSRTVLEMMDEYEITKESRNRAELEAENHRMEILRNANHQAEDIYAASVLYTEDALGRIQDIIDQAGESAREILGNLNRSMEEEKRVVRSNQLELITQLEDLNDTAKYIKLIEERNREMAKEKAKKQEEGRKKGYRRKKEKEEGFVPVVPEIKINEAYFEKEGVEMDVPLEDMTEEPAAQEEQEEVPDEPVVYEKPVIKVNKEYFEKAGISLEEEGGAAEDEEAFKETQEKCQGLFSFGRKPRD